MTFENAGGLLILNGGAMSLWTMERHRALHYKNHLTLFALFTLFTYSVYLVQPLHGIDLGGEPITLTLIEHIIPVLTLKTPTMYRLYQRESYGNGQDAALQSKIQHQS